MNIPINIETPIIQNEYRINLAAVNLLKNILSYERDQ